MRAAMNEYTRPIVATAAARHSKETQTRTAYCCWPSPATNKLWIIIH